VRRCESIGNLHGPLQSLAGFQTLTLDQLGKRLASNIIPHPGQRAMLVKLIRKMIYYDRMPQKSTVRRRSIYFNICFFCVTANAKTQSGGAA
jgi:hypothetical protein